MQKIQEMWVQFLGQEEPLEQEMATHSNILAWKFSWTRSLAGYSPWGCKESDTTEHTHTHTHTHIHTIHLGGESQEAYMREWVSETREGRKPTRGELKCELPLWATLLGIL